jgi:hypothetical protein
MTENDRGACEYHPGKMEKDWDWWLVYDGVAGSDSDVDRKQCPGGYIWTCCNKRGDQDACKVGRHKDKDGYL